MSWHFSQALEEAYSAGISSVGEQFAPSRLNHTLEISCSNDKTKECCPNFQSGTTSQLSTVDRGEELLTLYLEGFRAKTSARLDQEEESKEREADCGERWQESFAIFDRDTHSWKTPQCSLLEGSDEFSETWPKWGMMRHGVCSELPTWEPLTSENEYGLSGSIPNAKMGGGGGQMFPTPTCHNSRELTPSPSAMKRRSPGLGCLAAHGKIGPAGRLNPTWVEWLMGWPLGWTDLKPLEMDKFHVWQQQCLNTLEKFWRIKR